MNTEKNMKQSRAGASKPRESQSGARTGHNGTARALRAEDQAAGDGARSVESHVAHETARQHCNGNLNFCSGSLTTEQARFFIG